MVDDPDLQGFFSLSDFADGTREPFAPGSTYMESYELIRLAVAQDGGLFAIDGLRYVPPGSMEHGYILYEGLINGSSEYDGRWFSTTASGDAIMKRVLSSPSSPPLSTSLAALVAMTVLAFGPGLTLGMLAQRRRKAIPIESGKTANMRAA